jgi:hypothetical protein
MPFSSLDLICKSIAVGYVYHIIGDLITKGGIPIFPIPWHSRGGWQLWHHITLPNFKLAIETGGTINTILNYVMIVVDITLAYIIFFR